MLLSRRQAICGAGAAIAAPLAAPYVARAHFQINPATNRVYSKRAIELVQRAVVIDMLAPIKIDFSPEYYAKALSEKEAADFRASGITAIHRSEEHTSELQSLMRISYAVFCLKKKKKRNTTD